MGIEKLDHVHIYVKDLEKAKQRFKELLGVEFCEDITPQDVDSDTLVRTAEGRGTYATFGIELLEASPGSPAAKAIEPMEEGLGGVSIKVTNLEDAIMEFQQKGMRLIQRSQIGCYRVAWFHPRDAHGVLIELCEYQAANPLEALRQQP